jgi:diaminohydroxyphosphoribosylaminopyrimidine deaminase/5-amino-6-(5-phosphoribosylamino)uracil reductase
MNASFDASDHRFMAQAVRLAERGLYGTDPNPRVGCVVVKDGELVGEGWHRRAGEPHAERLALAAAGAAARHATVYVSLEPCAHHGRTPPCVDALIEAGVDRVVAASEDPNPLVAGQGMARLREAGIRAEVGLLADDAEALNPGFLKRMRDGLPFVRCKLAMSLDGRTAMASGESQWVTGDAARRDVQRLRARSSAVMTGVNTVLADDPSLNVRLDPQALGGPGDAGPVRQPLRVVLDSRLRTPPRARLLMLEGDTLVVCGQSAPPDIAAELEATGATVLRQPQLGGRIDLRHTLHELASRGVNEVLIESGPTLAGHALSAGLVDELILYVAPHLMGHQARGLAQIDGIQRMAERLAFRFADTRRVGADLRLTLRSGNG